MAERARLSLADSIRRAIRASGKSVNAIATASGAPQAVLCRFVAEQRGINLRTAEKVCAYLKLELNPSPSPEDVHR